MVDIASAFNEGTAEDIGKEMKDVLDFERKLANVRPLRTCVCLLVCVRCMKICIPCV